MKTKNKYPKSVKDFEKNPGFYEELAILKAQEKIAELMAGSNTKRTQLATLLKQSKAHVTELLSEGRNLTLRTFARVCFHLGVEVDFHTRRIGTQYNTDTSSVKTDADMPLRGHKKSKNK